MSNWPGDTGYTELLDRQDVPKYDLRLQVLGTLDEASSTLGLARALAITQDGRAVILELQEDLCWMMSELAAENAETPRKRVVSPARVARLDELMDTLEAEAPRAPDFVAPGDYLASAALHLARAIVRRAERLVTRLAHERRLHNPEILSYLNHLSMLLYVLARYEDAAAGRQSPTLARWGRQR
jgi:cob(I)alamin adenosyltransferase